MPLKSGILWNINFIRNKQKFLLEIPADKIRMRNTERLVCACTFFLSTYFYHLFLILQVYNINHTNNVNQSIYKLFNAISSFNPTLIFDIIETNAMLHFS